jgi:nitroimidazol reductase NimA-like FMN-containing flavoprotein (pyridoxamine 5'-phosphate oxidase superfamily)
MTARPAKDPSTADGPPMDREAMDRFLARRLIARLATSDGDRPRVLPMWFWWDGADVWMETSPTFANYRVIRRNPHAAVTIDEALSGLAMRAVVMRGRVEIIDAPLDQVMATVRRIHQRYLSPEEQASAAGRAMQLGSHVLLRFIPERTITWDTTA